MKDRIVRWALVVVLVGIVVWQRLETDSLEAQYRDLCMRQDKTERLLEMLPEMMDVALERQTHRLIAYWESRDDREKEPD